MKRWYAVYTHANTEARAEFHLRRQGFEAYLPRYAKRVRHARQESVKVCPLFPRYLFVHCDIYSAQWRPINSTVGVIRLVCRGDRPAAVPEDVIEGIRAREDDKGMVRLPRTPPFEGGQSVRIQSGPFRGQVGLFDCQTDDERVVVLLHLLGRDLEVAVQAGAVSAA